MRLWGLILGVGLAFGACTPALAADAGDALQAEVSAAVAQGQYQQAITLATMGLAESSASDLVRARLLAARALAKQALGANDEALADFTTALTVGALPAQEQARALFARGVSLDSLGRLDDAVGDYSGTLKLVPGAPYALNNRANVYRRQNRLEDARRDYRAALSDANPNPQYPYYGLGQIAEQQGDLEAARSFYNRALAADPGFPLARERLQVLGMPANGAASVSAGGDIVILRPPPARSGQKSATPRAFSAAKVEQPRPAPQGPATAGSLLRPAIVAAPSPSGAGLVQLGAWRSEAEARAGWMVAKDRAGGLLDGREPAILRTDIPGRGIYYRLRLEPAGSASQFCAALHARGVACVPAFR